MGWWNTTLAQLLGLGGRRNKPAPRPRIMRRRFEGAADSRLTYSWTRTPRTIDSQLNIDLRALTARARDLAQNSDFAARFLALARANVVGHAGIQLEARVPAGAAAFPGSRQDEPANQAIEAAWRAWGRAGVCDVTGRLSWADVQALALTSLLRDGEILLRHRDGPAPWRYAVQLLDPLLLDTSHNLRLANGSEIVMGVELTQDRRPVAFHFLADQLTPGYNDAYYGRPRFRVPADEVVHAFLPHHLGQTRGYSAFASAMLTLQQLDGYQEAALVHARMAASTMGFFTRGEDGAEPFSGDTVDDDGELTMEAEPGVFRSLPRGVNLATFSPEQPTGTYDAFVKRTLRSIAAGLGVSYHALANDLEGVNYSSARTGTLEDREAWRALQRFIAEQLCEPVYRQWLGVQLLTDTIRVAGQPLRLTDFTRYATVEWRPRRWAWVDPLKDAQAATLEIQQGLRTRASVIRERGEDPEQVFRDLVAERAELAAMGLDFSSAPAAAPAPERDETGADNADDQTTV